MEPKVNLSVELSAEAGAKKIPMEDRGAVPEEARLSTTVGIFVD